MANTYKLKTKTNIGITTVGIYTVPAATTTIIIGIALANISGTGVNVGVGITRVSAESIKLMKNVPIPSLPVAGIKTNFVVDIPTLLTPTLEANVGNTGVELMS